MVRSLPLATAGAALALLFGLEPAVAGNFEADSNIKIASLSLTRIEGNVKADRYFCIKDRHVTLYRQTGGSDPVVGSDQGDNQGAWAVKGLFLLGTKYYATVSRKSKNHNGSKHVCRAGRSPAKPVIL
jgi:hypothetical protein